MDVIVAKIRKNSREDVWITRGPYQGRDMLHVRIYFRDADGSHPTRKGIAIDAVYLEELISALKNCVDGKVSQASPATLPKSERERVQAYPAEFMNRALVHLRVFFKDASNGQWKPSNRGVALKTELVPDVIAALQVATRCGARERIE
jgi:Transcriptional Coactivator p15 (PC4)